MYHFLVETLKIGAQSSMFFSIGMALIKACIKKLLVAWVPEESEDI